MRTVKPPERLAGSKVIRWRISATGGTFAYTEDGRTFYRRGGAAKFGEVTDGRVGKARYA